MSNFEEALREAAALTKDDAAFNSGLSGTLSKIAKSISEIRKNPELLREVPVDPEVWTFLLRVASEKPSFAKRAWEVASLLTESDAWASAFALIEDKHRLNIAKAGPRDSAVMSNIVVRLLAAGAAGISDLLPMETVKSLPPALCAALIEKISAPGGLEPKTAEDCLASDVGQELQSRAAAGDGAEDKRRVIAPGAGKKAFGKDEGIPVFACEGISGSHQKMEISKVS